MYLYEYVIRCEMELARERERELLLDPERAWLRLEREQPILAPLIEAACRAIQSLAVRTWRALRAPPVRAVPGQASGQA